MKHHYPLIFALTMLCSLIGMGNAFAQNKINWHASFGAGLTDMRDFAYKFTDLQMDMYNLGEDNASFFLEMQSKAAPLLSAGIGLSGSFAPESILGWDAGLNIRTAGFGLKGNLLESQGKLEGFYKDMLPDVDKTHNFRYWALHLPVSLNYTPFETVGFTIGADLYYQFTPSPARDHPYGPLNRQMLFFPPTYQHPFQFGGHLGVFAPIGEKIRIDLQFLTDISPRMKIDHTTSGVQFREMGLMLNLQYKLGW